MLKGAIALTIRYVLLIGGSALATAGIIADTGNGHFCFDVAVVANTAANALILTLGGGVSVLGGIGWRFWAKKNNGLT